MKARIFIAFAALALAVVAVPEAQGKSGPDVDQRLFGHIIDTDIGEPGGLTTSVVNGIAKGQPGSAQFTAVLVFETDFVADARCPEEVPLGSNIIRFEWGETYSDGSLLTGFADADQALCTNGIVSVADITGVITGGTGRFEDASGTWRTVASSPTANLNTTGTFTVDLN